MPPPLTLVLDEVLEPCFYWSSCLLSLSNLTWRTVHMGLRTIAARFDALDVRDRLSRVPTHVPAPTILCVCCSLISWPSVPQDWALPLMTPCPWPGWLRRHLHMPLPPIILLDAFHTHCIPLTTSRCPLLVGLGPSWSFATPTKSSEIHTGPPADWL
jgi:hypothetical protein